ncbi:MAG: hypothetical protein WDN28_20160 [Chthoniobacter sp.]
MKVRVEREIAQGGFQLRKLRQPRSEGVEFNEPVQAQGRPGGDEPVQWQPPESRDGQRHESRLARLLYPSAFDPHRAGYRERGQGKTGSPPAVGRDIENGVDQEHGEGGESPGVQEKAALPPEYFPQMPAQEQDRARRGEEHRQETHFREPLQPTALRVDHDLILQLDLLVKRKDAGEGIEAVAEQRRIVPHIEGVVPHADARLVGNLPRLVGVKAGKNLAAESEHDRAEKERRPERGAHGPAIAHLAQAEQQVDGEPGAKGDQSPARFGGEQGNDYQPDQGKAATKDEPALARRRPRHTAAAEHRRHGKIIRRVIAIRKRPKTAPPRCPARQGCTLVNGVGARMFRGEGNEGDDRRGGEERPREGKRGAGD